MIRHKEKQFKQRLIENEERIKIENHRRNERLIHRYFDSANKKAFNKSKPTEQFSQTLDKPRFKTIAIDESKSRPIHEDCSLIKSKECDLLNFAKTLDFRKYIKNDNIQSALRKIKSKIEASKFNKKDPNGDVSIFNPICEYDVNWGINNKNPIQPSRKEMYNSLSRQRFKEEY